MNVATNGEVVLTADTQYIRPDFRDDLADYHLQTGDILFNNTNSVELVGKTAIVREPMAVAFSNHINRLRVRDPERIDPRWLALALRSLQEQGFFAAHCNKWIGQAGFSVSALAAVDVPLPYPDDPARSLEAQRRIVARIEALFAELREARRLHDEIVADTAWVVGAALVEVFGSSPTEDWVRIGAYVDHIENGKSPSCENRRANDDEWGVLKVGAVTYGFFNPDENKVLPPAYKPLPQYEIQTGDLLMSRANTRELVGATALVQETRRHLMLSDKIFRFRFRKDVRIVPAFLGYALKSPALRKQIEVVATGTSPSMKNISKDKVMNLMIPKFLPSRQQEIVGYLDTLQRNAAELQAIQEQMEASLVQMEQAILAQAFRGEL
jgi:type I restriction enzyme S subunit